MHGIAAETMGLAWLKSLELIMKYGLEIHDGERKLKEIRNLYVTIHDIREDDIMLQQYVDKDRIKLMKEKYSTCGLVGDYKIDYGSYIYNNNGINQMEWLKNRIKNKPETKSATITLHRPGENMLACLSLLDYKLRNNLLDMTAVYRSQNIFSSQPGNLVALRRMQADLAIDLNVNIGEVELVVISAHVYEEDYNNAIQILKAEGYCS